MTIIEKDGFRLIFNEPRNQGCISIESGSGGLSIFLDADDLMRISGATLAAARRIRKR